MPFTFKRGIHPNKAIEAQAKNAREAAAREVLPLASEIMEIELALQLSISTKITP